MYITINIVILLMIILAFMVSIMLNIYLLINRKTDIFAQKSAEYWRNIAMRWNEEAMKYTSILSTITEFLNIHWDSKEFPLEDVLYAIDHRNKK